MGKSHNREVPTMKISSDKTVKESSGSFYSSRADMHFQIEVALAGLHKDEFDMHQFTYMESTVWAQSCRLSFG